LQSHLVNDLRHYQAELEIQNKALRFSQSAAEAVYERFVTLFSNVPLPLMVVDERGQILQNNARALGLLRPLESDPPLTYFLPLISEFDVDKVRSGFTHAREHGVCELAEISIRVGLNGRVMGDLHIARLDSNEAGGVEFICAIIDQSPLIAQRSALQRGADALEQRNAQLLQSRSRLSAIIDASLDAIVSIDARHRITVFNPAAQALFGYTREQALGQVITQLLPNVESALAQQETSNPAQLGEMKARNRTGQAVSVEVNLSLEQHPDGAVATLFVHDLTSRKKMEARRATLELQLRESQKMQAVGTLAGGIAHDFNNIIGAILGNLVLAQQDAADNVAAMTSLREIEKAGRRARDLVRQILAFSRNEPPQRVMIQLADVVMETTRLLKVTLPPLVKLQVNIDPQTPPVLADATQIEQILLNLCTNAIHAIGKHSGTIQVELGYNLRQPDDSTERRGGLRGQHVKLSVSDDGIGMTEAVLQRVFEPFFTTKPVGQGTGLGLSVVHGIMRAHQGKVDVDSTVGAGSTFTLYFPIPDTLTTPQVASTPVAVVTKNSTGTGQRIIYVDDDEALVFLVKRLFSRIGYDIITYTDPRKALAVIRAQHVTCDLLVTDFNMPGYSGIDLIRDVHALRPMLPLALASGYITPEIEREALAAGAKAMIHKPNDVDEFCRTVQQLLTNHDAPA